MKWFSTREAEKLYDILVRYSEANPDYYSRELFIFHYGVCSNTSRKFRLNCMDGANRTFVVEDDFPKVIGKGATRTNAMIRNFMQPEIKQIEEFTIVSREF